MQLDSTGLNFDETILIESKQSTCRVVIKLTTNLFISRRISNKNEVYNITNKYKLQVNEQME